MIRRWFSKRKKKPQPAPAPVVLPAPELLAPIMPEEFEALTAELWLQLLALMDIPGRGRQRLAEGLVRAGIRPGLQFPPIPDDEPAIHLVYTLDVPKLSVLVALSRVRKQPQTIDGDAVARALVDSMHRAGVK